MSRWWLGLEHRDDPGAPDVEVLGGGGGVRKRTGRRRRPPFSHNNGARVTGVRSEAQRRRNTRFHSLPSRFCSRSLLKSKSSSRADALLSPEMGGGGRRRRTNLAVLYTAFEREDVCYMAVR
ncbi:hypothetical protein EYF80_035257 [Liparis tanakae]|uniref:Uncharacterized protein n=1 Tax=Liparis tanakae TaxID=230148 RepID=A0A4Z2GP63_9TELE|nr:hypothetical protein EYF80_035257 [Liparis tanakae]